MTRILGFLLAGLLLTPLSAAAGDLTLRDVMELHRTGLGDDLLIAVIDADGGPFRLSFADIQDLKSDGLSERVIAALVRTGARQPMLDGVDTVVEPVQVYQEVVTYVPGLVVVGTPVVPVWRDEHRSGAPPAPGTSVLTTPQPPPATWVTRQEDGKNVPASRARSLLGAARHLGDAARSAIAGTAPAGPAQTYAPLMRVTSRSALGQHRRIGLAMPFPGHPEAERAVQSVHHHQRPPLRVSHGRRHSPLTPRAATSARVDACLIRPQHDGLAAAYASA